MVAWTIIVVRQDMVKYNHTLGAASLEHAFMWIMIASYLLVWVGVPKLWAFIFMFGSAFISDRIRNRLKNKLQ